MSEEKQVEKSGAIDGADLTQPEVPLSRSSTAETGEKSVEKAPVPVSPTVHLLFIMAAVFFLAVIGLRQCKRPEAGVRTDDAAVAALKADLEAQRSELNRQRIELGLPPLEGGSEPIAEIAERLKQDADALVGVSGRFQQMLGEKDLELSERNSELLRSEKLRQAAAMENSRLQEELRRASSETAETDRLRTMLADSENRRDALSMELTEAQGKLAAMDGYVSADEFGDLKRRYEEALREKQFYEDRVKELDGQAEDGE